MLHLVCRGNAIDVCMRISNTYVFVLHFVCEASTTGVCECQAV